MERKCWENEQYSRRECIEILGIPQSIEQLDLEKTVLHVFDKIDAPVEPRNIGACHRLKPDDSGRSNKVTWKFSKSKDIVRVMNKKKSLKMLTKMVQVSSQALHYLLILVFAVTRSICGLNVKHNGQVN